tara:strand:+ start:23 stop:502 length:480 start_codon:yes stop_codon:yes gene_type:complete
MELWKKCVQLKKPILICEDDFNGTWNVNTLQSTKTFLSIENITTGSKDITQLEKLSTFMGTQAYIITPMTARILLSEFTLIGTQVDWYIFYISFKHPNTFFCTTLYNKKSASSLSSSLNHDRKCVKMFLPCDIKYYIMYQILLVLLVVGLTNCFSKRSA